jgi:hypothetical protein
VRRANKAKIFFIHFTFERISRGAMMEVSVSLPWRRFCLVFVFSCDKKYEICVWKVKRNHSAVNGGEADFYLLKIKFPAASWASRFCSPHAMACSVLRRHSPKGKNHHQTAVARNQTIRATCNVNERKRSIIRFHYTGSSLPGALLDFQLSVDFVSCSKSISEVKKGFWLIV